MSGNYRKFRKRIFICLCTHNKYLRPSSFVKHKKFVSRFIGAESPHSVPINLDTANVAKNVHSKCFDWIITPSLTNATTRPKPKLEIRKQQMNSISPVSIYSNVKTAQQRAG